MRIINNSLIMIIFTTIAFNGCAVSINNMTILDCQNRDHNYQATHQVVDDRLSYDGSNNTLITVEKIAIVKQSRLLFNYLSDLCAVSSALTPDQYANLISSRLSMTTKYIDKVYFATGRSDSGSADKISMQIASSKEKTQAIVIIGSADSVGNAQFNSRLALNRARFVANKLDKGRYPIFLISLGDSVARKFSEENASQPFFRRADVYLVTHDDQLSR